MCGVFPENMNGWASSRSSTDTESHFVDFPHQTTQVSQTVHSEFYFPSILFEYLLSVITGIASTTTHHDPTLVPHERNAPRPAVRPDHQAQARVRGPVQGGARKNLARGGQADSGVQYPGLLVFPCALVLAALPNPMLSTLLWPQAYDIS